MKQFFIINGRFLTQNTTGVHRYAYEICCALSEIGADFKVVVPKGRLDTYDCPFDVIEYGKLSSHFWEQISLPLFMKKYYPKAILLNFTGLGAILHKRKICTIHDLSFLENPSWFSFLYYHLYRLLMPIVARKSLKIITVSQFSKTEILKYFGVASDKVQVVYNAVSIQTLNQNAVVAKEKYILSVASIDPRKNFIRLLKAFQQLKTKGYKLLIVGKKNQKIFKKLELAPDDMTNVHFTGYVSDQQLSDYYAKATLFIYPSLYEGFGIPNIEAMSNGCPVATSSIPPHIEVCGEAATYFDPANVQDIKEKIDYLLQNEQYREHMIQKGYQQVKKYDWIQSAQQISECIDMIPKIVK